MKFFKDEKQLQPWLQAENIQSQKILLQAAQNLGWENADEERLFLKSIICRIELSDKAIKIELCGNAIVPALRSELSGKPDKDNAQPIILNRAIKLAATNNGSKVIHLCFPAPDIIESIVEGTQPVDWTVEKLFAIKTSDWQSQRKILGLI